MNNRAIIIGCGGHAHVVAAMLEQNKIDIAGFVDPSFDGQKEKIFKHYQLLDKPDVLTTPGLADISVFIALGNNSTRREYFSELNGKYLMPSIIHESAIIDESVLLGAASQICMGAILSVETTVGDGTIINTGSQIDHESKIGSFCHIAPGAILAGKVIVGDNCFIGMGARIDANVCVGEGAIIGAGSIVLKDVPKNHKVVGVHH